MGNWLSWISRSGDKTGALGVLVSTMGCGMCFPALASLGAGLGLGFLQQFEGLFVSTLLPLFALVALAANGLGYLRHRQRLRSGLGMAGPVIVLAGSVWLFGTPWMRTLVYTGTVVMLGIAIWDLISPASRRCATDGCDLPAGQR